jgi:glycine/D-amino acid oxidase-like deaminating enzyme
MLDLKCKRGRDAAWDIDAERRGVRFVGNTEVTGFDVRGGRVRAVHTHTSQATVEVDPETKRMRC